MGIFQLSIDGTFLSANPKLASLLGFDLPDEMMDFYKHLPSQLFVDSNSCEKLLELVKKRWFC